MFEAHRAMASARSVHRLVRVGACLAGLAGSAGCDSPRAEQPPPVIVYVVDTLRADHLEVYGYERKTAPRLALLAQDGVVFERAYAPTSWTKPSTASLLSGLTPVRHGASNHAQAIGEEIELLPETLRNAGYETAAFVTNPWIVRRWGFDQGFDVFRPLLDNPFAETLVNAVLARMERGHDRPFFYYLHALDPHSPYQNPAGFQHWPRARQEVLHQADLTVDGSEGLLADVLSAYDAEIAYGDHHFGRLLDHLIDEGLYERSLIIFTADHGEEFLEHGKSGHGRTLHEEVVRVPFVLKLPGNAHGGRRISMPVSLVDIAPTIYANAGVPPRDQTEGIDLSAILADDGASGDPDRALFLDLDLSHEGEWNRARAVVLGSLKLIETESPVATSTLFDLSRDPLEAEDLAERSPVEAARLHEVLEARRSATRRGFHLALVNDVGARVTRYRGRLRTEQGRLQIHALGQLEAEDRAEISEDGRELHFDLTGRNLDDPKQPHRFWHVDEDWVRFDVEPPDARVFFETFSASGDPGQIFLGPEYLPAGALPLAFGLADSDLGLRDPALLLPRSVKALRGLDPGAYLAAVAPVASRTITDLDPSERARLRALGYLAD